MKLLVVDDDRAALEVAKYCLAEHYELYLASSGPEALLVLASNRIDVMVCDQRMPGMSGAELCQQAAEVSPDTAQIMITAYSDFQDLRRAVMGGKLVACLQKPMRERELVEVIERTQAERHKLEPTRASQRPSGKLRDVADHKLQLAESEAEEGVASARAQLRESRRALSGTMLRLNVRGLDHDPTS